MINKMNEHKGLERLLKHEKITESVRKEMTKKKDFYEKKLDLINLLLKKGSAEPKSKKVKV